MNWKQFPLWNPTAPSEPLMAPALLSDLSMCYVSSSPPTRMSVPAEQGPCPFIFIIPSYNSLQASEYLRGQHVQSKQLQSIQRARSRISRLPDRQSMQRLELCWGGGRALPCLYSGSLTLRMTYDFFFTPCNQSLDPRGADYSTVSWPLNPYLILGALRASCLTVMF